MSELSLAVKELALLKLHRAKNEKTFKTGKSVADPLPKPYNAIAEDIFRGYGDTFSKDQIEGHVREFVGCTVSQLKAQKKAYDTEALNQQYALADKIYIESGKAKKILTLEFGHTDPKINQELLDPILEDTNRMEDLWLNCMELLKSKGFPFYIAKLASDKFVFPHGLGDPIDPYQYYEWKTSPVLKRHYSPKFLCNPKITEWKAEEAEETKRLEETFLAVYKDMEEKETLDAQRRRNFLEYWRPHLTQYITSGFPDIRIRKEMKKRYGDETVNLLMSQVTELRQKGYKSKNGRIKIEAEIEEEPEPDLDNEWIQCMAHKSGKAGQDGRITDAKPFDNAVQTCNFTVFRDTGKQPSPSAFEKVKAFWEPGYWFKHTDKPEEALADLKTYCANTYGKGWTYKHITDTADGVDKDACVSPDGTLTAIIDYRDVLRGTTTPTQPQTAKGKSVEKKIVRIKI